MLVGDFRVSIPSQSLCSTVLRLLVGDFSFHPFPVPLYHCLKDAGWRFQSFHPFPVPLYHCLEISEFPSLPSPSVPLSWGCWSEISEFPSLPRPSVPLSWGCWLEISEFLSLPSPSVPLSWGCWLEISEFPSLPSPSVPLSWLFFWCQCYCNSKLISIIICKYSEMRSHLLFRQYNYIMFLGYFSDVSKKWHGIRPVVIMSDTKVM